MVVPCNKVRLLHFNIPDILFITMEELAVTFTGFKQSFNVSGFTIAMRNQVAEFFMLPQPVTVEGMILQIGNDNTFFLRGGEEIGGGK